MDTVLTDLVKALAQARADAQAAQAAYQDAKAAFEAQHADAIAAMRATAARVEELDAQVRATTLDLWRGAMASGQPKPQLAPGVTVKMFTVLKYGRDKALAWAAERKIALALDVKAFEGYAKVSDASGRLAQDGLEPWLVVDEEPRAQIATDLNKALGQVDGG